MSGWKRVGTEHGKSASYDVNKKENIISRSDYTVTDRDSGKVKTTTKDRSYAFGKAKDLARNS